MGMTIDTAIDIIENPTDYFPKDIEETKHFMIDTMRKYQKIEQIAFPLQFCSTDKLEHEAIMKICEVIEDGKID